MSKRKKVRCNRVYDAEIDYHLYERLVHVWIERPDDDTIVLWHSPPYSKERRDVLVFHGPWGENNERRYRIVGKYVRASIAKAEQEAARPSAVDPSFRKSYPAVAEFLTDPDDGNGGRRKLAKMTVFFEHNTFKVFLNDVESRKSLCVSSETFQGLWDVLEAAIKSDAPGWRDMPDFDDKKKKKG